jgi:hypothetical protein
LSRIDWLCRQESVGRVGGCDIGRTSPQSPGRSVTEVIRNRSAAKGKTIRRRRPSRSAGRAATRSAPQAAEQTSTAVARGYVRYSELAADRFKDFWRD